MRELLSYVFLPNYAPYETRGEGEERYYEGTNTEEPTYFNPFYEERFFENLINDARSLDLSKDCDVEEFCNKYGLPSYKSLTKKKWVKMKIDDIRKNALQCALEATTNLLSPFVKVWFHKIKPIFLVVGDLSITIISADDKYCNRKFEKRNKAHRKCRELVENNAYFQLIENGTLVEGIWGVQNFVEMLDIITKRLTKKGRDPGSVLLFVNKMLQGTSFDLDYKKGSYGQIYSYTTLLQATGIYFMDMLLRKSNLKVCAYPKCGKLFVQTHKRQKYCPTPEGYVKGTRSRCENNHRYQRYARRKKGRESSGATTEPHTP